MKNTQRTLPAEDSTKENEMHLAFELSHSKWKLAFGQNGVLSIVPQEFDKRLTFFDSIGNRI